MTVDKADLDESEPAGDVPDYLMTEVDQGLRRVLDLCGDDGGGRRGRAAARFGTVADVRPVAGLV